MIQEYWRSRIMNVLETMWQFGTFLCMVVPVTCMMLGMIGPLHVVALTIGGMLITILMGAVILGENLYGHRYKPRLF